MFIAAPGMGIRTAQGGKDNRQNNVLFKDGSVIYKAVKRPEEEGWNAKREGDAATLVRVVCSVDVSSGVDIHSSSKSAFKSKQTLVARHNRCIVSL